GVLERLVPSAGDVLAFFLADLRNGRQVRRRSLGRVGGHGGSSPAPSSPPTLPLRITPSRKNSPAATPFRRAGGRGYSSRSCSLDAHWPKTGSSRPVMPRAPDACQRNRTRGPPRPSFVGLVRAPLDSLSCSHGEPPRGTPTHGPHPLRA